MAVAVSLKRMSRMKPEELKKLFGLSELPTSYKDLDPKRLPEKTLEEFSYDGLGFEEAATKLWNHLTIMHYHAGTYNRHSEYFPIACAQLEKDIRLSGSFCLTKAVLEQKGQKFPSLDKINIETLYGVTSYYFRKCGKAFEDLYEITGLISLKMHEWELRWYELGERLKATQEKIKKILDGKIDIDSLVNRAEMYKSEKPLDAATEKSDPKPLTLRKGALPLLGTYARQMIGERIFEAREKLNFEKFSALREKAERNRALEEKKAAAEQQRKEKAQNADESAKQSAAEQEPVKEQSSAPLQEELRKTGMTAAELRMALMKKAEKRGEGSEIMRIAGEPPEALLERWKRYTREEMMSSSAASSHNRKKHRKKR